MYLKRIYSNPSNLFQEVEFIDGVNFIFGKKDETNDPKNSLNGIGKSTFLDLVDFCLLASFQKDHSPRLYSFKKVLEEYEITLEVEIDGENYTLTRGFKNPNEVRFGTQTGKIENFQVKDLRQKLFDLVFKNESYDGRTSNKWFRKFIPFFLKIQRPKKDRFVDPVAYLPEASVVELIQYHLFLLGINNEAAFRNFDIQSILKRKEPAMREIKKLIEEMYGLKNISQVSNEVTRIRKDINGLEKAVSAFKLQSTYDDAQMRANEITGKIKENVYSNFSDRRKIDSYEESYKIKTDLDTKRVKRIYSELSAELGVAIKNTLDEAILFRKKLAESRESFIENEIKNLKKTISSRESEIEKLESERAEIFNFLAAREAIKDLTEAFYAIGEKKNRLNELESKIKVYEDLEKEKAELKVAESSLEKEILDFLVSIKSQVEEIRLVFGEIYDAVYPENKDESMFSITASPSSDAKIAIDVAFPAMHSKGRNQGRILIYDLCVLFNAIRTNLPGPKFLVHDGIFDGMDKAHFVALYNYLENLLSRGIRFQYIVTFNEEGTLTEKFGDTDRLTPEKIEQQAILTLTPSKKLFGRDF